MIGVIHARLGSARDLGSCIAGQIPPPPQSQLYSLFMLAVLQRGTCNKQHKYYKHIANMILLLLSKLSISRSQDLWKIRSVDKRTIIYSISLFRENNNVVVFPIPFHIFMPYANRWLIRLQGQFPILRTRSCPDPVPAHSPSEKAVGIW